MDNPCCLDVPHDYINLQYNPSLWTTLVDQKFYLSLFYCSHFYNAKFFSLEGSAPDDMVLWTFLPLIISGISLSKVGLFEFLKYLLWWTMEIRPGKKYRSTSGLPDSDVLPYIFRGFNSCEWMSRIVIFKTCYSRKNILSCIAFTQCGYLEQCISWFVVELERDPWQDLSHCCCVLKRFLHNLLPWVH